MLMGVYGFLGSYGSLLFFFFYGMFMGFWCLFLGFYCVFFDGCYGFVLGLYLMLCDFLMWFYGFYGVVFYWNLCDFMGWITHIYSETCILHTHGIYWNLLNLTLDDITWWHIVNPLANVGTSMERSAMLLLGQVDDNFFKMVIFQKAMWVYQRVWLDNREIMVHDPMEVQSWFET